MNTREEAFTRDEPDLDVDTGCLSELQIIRECLHQLMVLSPPSEEPVHEPLRTGALF